jgi:hypothetical protein
VTDQQPTTEQATTEQPTTEKTGPPRVEEVWTYAGRRERKGKRYFAWQDTDGTERLYEKVPGVLVGGRYTVTVARDGENTWIYGEPLFAGSPLNERIRHEMEALDIAATTALAAKKRERNQARTRALDDAIQPLVKIAAKLNFGDERDAFLAYVIRRLTQPW